VKFCPTTFDGAPIGTNSAKVIGWRLVV
jgi:hypothetical protein